MLLHEAPDPILYQAFPATLKGVVQYWYSSLKLGQYTLSSSWVDPSSNILLIVRDSKSGRTITISLNKEKGSQSKPLSATSILQSWRSSTWINKSHASFDEWSTKNDLKRLVTKIYPQDLTNMLAQIEKYAQMEDAFIEEEAPTTSILGSGERTKIDREHSLR